MPTPRFLQIHTLHAYPAALLNRDDAGLAKRLPYGGTVRTRISSQCLKRRWRKDDGPFALSTLGLPMADRSRFFIGHILQRLQNRGVSLELAEAAASALFDGLFKKSEKPKKKSEPDNRKKHQTGQAVLLGRAEVDYLVDRCVALAKEHADPKQLFAAVEAFLAGKADRDNINAMKLGSGLESALFGRMVTSDVLAQRDASIYVAHAFTVHEAQVENDYFTVVDDLLQEEGDSGSAGIFDTELSSGLYYGYVVVDVPQLVANLEGVPTADCFKIAAERRETAACVVDRLLHLIAMVSPGAKRGATAPFGWAQWMLVEASDWQPCSLAGAFMEAVPLADRAEPEPLVSRSVARLARAIEGFDQAYGAPHARRYLATEKHETMKAVEQQSLNKLAGWTADAVRKGQCA